MYIIYLAAKKKKSTWIITPTWNWW